MPGYHDPVQHRLSTLSLDAIEEYFAQLNPIAKRIAFDISDTKANYGKLWNTLGHHEQNEIINDTLIKPEISLRYFDNFLTPTPTNSSAHSYQSSTDSLTAIVFKDVNARRVSAEIQEDREKVNMQLKLYGAKINSHDIKSFYSYNGRSLHTFGMQKVALKVIQDEALGCFRDEHSRPFSYRTKSQINLFALPIITETTATRKATDLCKKTPGNTKTAALTVFEDFTTEDEESKKALVNYHRLQHQLKINLQEKKSQESKNSSIFSSSVKPSSISTSRKFLKSPDSSFKHENKDVSFPVFKTTKSSMLQNYIKSTQLNVSPKMCVNYAVFSDAYNTTEESSNLLQQNDLAMGSCSSAATSDDDDKTLEEDVHLLDNDSNIRKGFDFLNNW